MRVTIKQLKSFISEAVRTAHVPSVKNHKSELARLKKIIKEQVEDAVNGKGEEKVDPITREAAALSPDQAKIELEELLRDAPPELIEKLKDLISDPEFKEKKAALSESDNRHTGTFALAAASAGVPLVWLSSMIAQYGINDPSSGLSPAALATLVGLLAAGTLSGIVGAVHSAMKPG
jgi:hypothetical protein